MPRPLPESAAADRTSHRSLLIAALALSGTLGTTYHMGFSAFIPFIADDLGSSVPVVGQITTMVFLIGALSGIAIGPLADRYGHGRFQMLGTLLVIAGSLGTAIAPDLPVLFAVRTVSAFSTGMLAAVTTAATATLYTGSERHRAMSWVVTGIAGGPIVGIPFLALVASVAGWRAGFVSLALVAIPILILQYTLFPHPRRVAGAAPFRPVSLTLSYQPLVRHRPTMVLYGSHILRAVAWIGILTYFSAFLDASYGLDEREIGWATMVAGAGYFAGSMLARGRLAGYPLRPLYSLTTALMGCCLVASLMLPVHPAVSTAFVAAAAVFGSLSFICQTTLLANTTPAGQATTMSLNAAFFGVGSAAGGAVGGGLIALGGYNALALGLAGFALLSAGLMAGSLRVAVPDPSIEPSR